MVDLAIRSNGEQVALKSIAESQNISESYLEQVFSLLRKAGLVKSIKGAQGGYVLSGPLSEIKVGDILRALEGSLNIIDFSSETEKIAPNSIQYCIKVNVWDKINECINQVVDNITLEDLVNEYKKMNGPQALMYYI